jgi:hypothetical protein
MGYQNSSLRPNEMGCPSSRRKGMPHRLGASGGKCDAPQSIGMICRNPPLRPNEMPGLLTAPERDRMLPIAPEGNAATPHRLGRKRDALQGIGVKCQNFPLRPNEMGCSPSPRKGVPQPLTAPAQNGMTLGASEENVRAPHCVQMRCRNPTSSEWNGMLLIASEVDATTVAAPGGNGMPLRASE